MKKNSNIIIRVEDDIKDAFYDYAKRNGQTVSALLSACMLDLIKRNMIPRYLRPHLYRLEEHHNTGIDIPMIKLLLEESIKEAKLENKIEKAYLFGSYSRGEQTEESDIDIRIEHKNHFDLFDLSELSTLLKEKTGKNIDIATQPASKMDPVFYNAIRKDEICIYEQP